MPMHEQCQVQFCAGIASLLVDLQNQHFEFHEYYFPPTYPYSSLQSLEHQVANHGAKFASSHSPCSHR
uniref:Uncharacterized protein n=1 Tax=Rhizophora mucronata TaxID=61149 RepID=A0A2P2QHG3_RHIMU